jgi:hypothetical protein
MDRFVFPPSVLRAWHLKVCELPFWERRIGPYLCTISLFQPPDSGSNTNDQPSKLTVWGISELMVNPVRSAGHSPQVKG